MNRFRENDDAVSFDSLDSTARNRNLEPMELSNLGTVPASSTVRSAPVQPILQQNPLQQLFPQPIPSAIPQALRSSEPQWGPYKGEMAAKTKAELETKFARYTQLLSGVAVNPMHRFTPTGRNLCFQ